MGLIYSPREDSYLLYKEVKRRAKDKKVLDMGTGSGILAIGAKKGGAIEVLAVDINPDAVAFVKKKGVEAVESDLFEKVNGKFDLIVFNPPYLPENESEDAESKLATTGGKKGDEVILRFLEVVCKFLNSEGNVLLLVSNLTSTKRIEDLIQRKGLSKEVIASEKLFMEELFVWKLQRKF